MAQSVSFRYPTQNVLDVELVEEVPVRAGLAGHGLSELELAYGTPHPRATGHRLVWQEPVAGGMRRIYRRLPGMELGGEAVRSNSWGAVVTTTQDVPTGTPADTGLNVLESIVEPKDAQMARKKTTTVEWPELITRSLESQTGTPMTTTRRMVAADAPLPENTPLTLERKVEDVNKWRSIQVITSLDALPAAYAEYRERSYRFPGLFYSFNPSGGGVTQRAAFTRSVMARVEISFGHEPVEPELFVVTPVSWRYPLGFNVSEVLTNGEIFNYIASGSPVSLTVPASTPTRAQYEALVGSYIPIAGKCERWKGTLWRTELWKIRLL